MKPPRIEFPCDYPIKIIGRHDFDFEAVVLSVVRKAAPDFDAERSRLNLSGRGNYCSLTVWITAESEAQLKELFEALKATGKVSLVL